MRRTIFGILLVLVIIGAGVQSSLAEFQPWSEKVFESIEQEYGPQAVKRVRYLHDLVIKNQDLPVKEKLALVNKTMNHLPWIADETLWKKADYWATPMETIATFGGDCEDMAIAKWVLLNHLGVPSSALRLAYVKIKKTGESHMVLLYVENPQDAPEKQRTVVLDNYTEEIKPAKERTDLLGVFVTDANGNLALIADDGEKRSIKKVMKGKKIRSLEDLKAKIIKNRQKYQAINDGRPIVPPPS